MLFQAQSKKIKIKKKNHYYKNIVLNGCADIRYSDSSSQDGENLSKAQHANRLADYLEKAKECYKQTVLQGQNKYNKYNPPRAKLGLRNHNRLFLQDIIKENPESTAYKTLMGTRPGDLAKGSGGNKTNISQIYVTKKLIDILRKTS